MSPKKKNKRRPVVIVTESTSSSRQSQKQDAVKLIAILIILGLVMTLFVGAMLSSPAQASQRFAAMVSTQTFDTDNDGQENNVDADIDGDGIGNGNDEDIDGDGIINSQDGDPAGTLGISGGTPPTTLKTPTELDKALPAQVRYPIAAVVVIAGVLWLLISRRNKRNH